jgi:hypothetical protein
MEDDAHRKAEEERRARRKAAKSSKSDAQLEKERKRKEHSQKILQRQSGDAKRQKTTKATVTFSKLLEQRTQGFQIEFAFRNAPPRPPVGPCFVGRTLDAIMLEESRVYKARNAVEVSHKWKLHAEVDLGVPIAPSAMDVKSYSTVIRDNAPTPALHEDDMALLDWKGNLGDSAAEQLKLRQDRARAEARALLVGKSVQKSGASSSASHQQKHSKRAFSRVLDDPLQTWMKKTTYLSNDYSRKVHDFKSLAQTKQDLAVDLQFKQVELAKRRSNLAITQSFETIKNPLLHPTRKNLKPKAICSVLPHADQWGKAFTHLVIDKAPNLLPQYEITALEDAMVTNVEKMEANARMTCQVAVPAKDPPDELKQHEMTPYHVVQAYDLDVIPLKEEDAPHSNFCFWVDIATSTAYYVPISSRVQLSTGRPGQSILQSVGRRPVSNQEQIEREERMAEVDQDMAEKHHIVKNAPPKPLAASVNAIVAPNSSEKRDSDGDGEGDFGDEDDSDSDDEQLFGGGTKTIVAES